jgi:hypothetical protein
MGKQIKKFSKVIITFICILLIISIISCSSGATSKTGSPGTTNNNGNIQTTSASEPAAVDISSGRKTAKIGPEGGEIKLEDGAVLSVKAQALSKKTEVVLEKLDMPQGFGDGAVAYDISGLAGATGKVELTFKTETGLNSEELSVFRYDTNTEQCAALNYSYDTVSGLVDVILNGTSTTASAPGNLVGVHMMMAQKTDLPGTFSQGMLDKVRVVFTTQEQYKPASAEKLLNLPYYEQSGGSCWAADAMMMIRGYSSDVPNTQIGSALNFCKCADTDFGLGTVGFTQELVRYIGVRASSTATWNGYLKMNHLHWKILEELDKGHPLILKLPGLGHYVLVVGYQDNGDKLVLHDSKAMSVTDKDGGMYCVRPWSWVTAQQGGATVAMQILYVKDKPAQANSLLSIVCPGAGESMACSYGKMTFYAVNPAINHKVDLAMLQFHPSSPGGVCWYSAGSEIMVVPSNATNLYIEAPIYNAGMSADTADVEIRVYNDYNLIYSTSIEGNSLPPAEFNETRSVTIKKDIPLENIRLPQNASEEGTLPVTIVTRLMKGEQIVDQFSVDAVLSVIPIVTKVDPVNTSPGGEITITGNCFGKEKSKKSAVLLNNTSCDIVSWSEAKIVAKIPSNMALGKDLPLIVVTGEQYEYQSKPVKISLVKDTTVTGTFDSSDLNDAYGDYLRGITFSGSWELTGADAANCYADQETAYFSLRVWKDTPARLVINADAQMVTPTATQKQDDGSTIVITYHDPKLLPPTEGTVFRLKGNPKYTLNSSDDSITVDFTLDKYDQSIDIDLTFEIRCDVKEYDKNGTLVKETNDQFVNTLVAAVFFIKAD